MRLLPLAAAPLALALAGPALSAGPPTLDVASTCRSSGSANPDAGTASNGCLRSENEARDTLRQRWGEFGGQAQRQCSLQSNAGGFPSYVELLTCLELATGSVAVRPSSAAPAQGGSATGGPATTGSTGSKPVDVTPEADPRQRIDPKAVLGKSTGSDD